MNIVDIATFNATELLCERTKLKEEDMTFCDDEGVYRWKEEYQEMFDEIYDTCYDIESKSIKSIELSKEDLDKKRCHAYKRIG